MIVYLLISRIFQGSRLQLSDAINAFFTEILSKVFEIIYIVSAKICSSIRFSFQLLRVIEEEGTLFYLLRVTKSTLFLFCVSLLIAYTLRTLL